MNMSAILNTLNTDDSYQVEKNYPDSNYVGKLSKNNVLHLMAMFEDDYTKNFNLLKVINLNGDFFLNTCVKTSILFF